MTPTRLAVPSILAAALVVSLAAVPALAQEPAAAPAPGIGAGGQAEKPDPTLTLAIGDPKLKGKVMEVRAGAVLAGRTGAAVGFERVIGEMMAARIVHLGETHDSLPMHDLQLRVIEALHARDRHLAIGLEMVPAAFQETLNKWTAGILTKEEFLREIRWYVTWNFNFGYYEKIFDFAKEHRLPIYGLNAPREVISKIRMRGWDALSDGEKALFPGPPDVSHQDHRTLIRTVFESEDIPEAMKGPGLDKMFEGLYRGQSAWDEVMGWNAVRAARAEGRRVVVCVGSGHLLYNLGLNRRAYERSKLPFRTVVAVEVPAGKGSLTVSRALADYVFGLPVEEGRAFPSVGLGLKKVDGLENLVVDPKPSDGLAGSAGFEKGDVVLSVDGTAYTDVNELRMRLAGIPAGGEAKFKVLRAGAVKDVALKHGKASAGTPEEKKRPD
mgnify:FL=1